MSRDIVAALAVVSATSAMADVIGFDSDKAGALPAGWIAGVTGSGAPQWAVASDPKAPTPPNVLLQSGKGSFPWCVRKDVSLADGFVQVKFRPIAGRKDQAGGVVWRWKDGDNYYVARANALENNVSLYHTSRGRRNTIKYVDAPVARSAWHVLRVEYAGTRIKVMLNGTTYIDLEDRQISGPGAVGVWTKADSITSFDDFSFGK